MSSLIKLNPSYCFLDYGNENEFVFELLVFLHSLIILGCQHLNLYKTFWWLPYSTATYAVNISLVDLNLCLLLFSITTRRIFYFSYQTLNKTPVSFLSSTAKTMWKLVFFVVVISFFYSSFQLVEEKSLSQLIPLFYPLATYLVLFRTDLKPLFTKVTFLNKYGEKQKQGNNPSSSNLPPEDVRNEVLLLKNDFNYRMMQVLFNSMISTYYLALMPFYYSPKFLTYDPKTTLQFILLTFFGFLSLNFNNFLSPNYLKNSYQLSTSLGFWIEVTNNKSNLHNLLAWSEMQTYHQEETVKHVKGLFKSGSLVTTAQPGNFMHYKFYMIFHKPRRLLNWSLFFNLLVIIATYLFFLYHFKWDIVIISIFLLFPLFYVMFYQLRNKFIMDKIYKNF